MKIIQKSELQNHELDDVIQCPKCYNFLLLEQNDMNIKCQYCGYDMQYYTIKRHNSKLVQTVQIMTNALESLLDQNYGVVVVVNNKKILVRNLDKQIYIEQIDKSLQNYQQLINKKIVKIS